MARRKRGGRKARARGRASGRGWRARLLGGVLRCALPVLALLVLGTALPIAGLRWLPPPTSAFMLWSRFDDPATGRPCERVRYRWAGWQAISPHLPRAIVVAEDQRFLAHNGFDTKSIGKAVDRFVAGGRMRGASTVTQQVAKNLFLWPGRSVARKALEGWLTVWIEVLWPKRRILEVYVNVAQFGPCVFGAEAASRRYFGRPASQLSALEAARMAAVLPAPGRYHVADPGPYVAERTLDIFVEMHRGGRPGYLRGL